MFTIDTTGRNPHFATFAQAADCAVIHAIQRGEAIVRYGDSGIVAARFWRRDDGTVSIISDDDNVIVMIEDWAR